MDSGMLSAILDLTTTEICDMVAGGVFAADEDRFGASIRAGLPYIGACGALDMVNFNARTRFLKSTAAETSTSTIPRSH